LKIAILLLLPSTCLSPTAPDPDNFQVKKIKFFFSYNKKLIFTPQTNIIYKMDDGPARIIIINQI
jgi:hypothetical protein